ncbi:MAG TPA: transcription termination factor Rho [Ilumatobacter sp.]|nr:transcription termination factor Rho [Ilumatobacter sp.]
MTANALDQSVLESKDKTQLVQIAEALGIKANGRSKKSDIIGQILDMTGPSSPAQPAAPAPPAASSTAPARPARPAVRQRSAAPTLPLDEEPKADWELAIADVPDGTDTTADGNVAGQVDTKPEPTDTADAAKADGAADTSSDTSADGAAAEPSQDRVHAAPSSERSGDRNNDRPASQQGGQNRQQNRQGNGQGNSNNSNSSNDESRSKRRRRRRKGRGADGPQGEDRDLLDDDGEIEVIAGPGPVSTEAVQVEGYLDMRDEGYGFLRTNNYLATKADAYLPVKLARQFGVRKGDHIVCMSRPAGRNEKNPGIVDIISINGRTPEDSRRRSRFEDLTALFPDERLRMEDPADPGNMIARIIDLVCPIGKGQRGIIVSPPKAGKTTVMKNIVASIEKNNPECKTIVLLIDERPEEVTDMQRNVKGEVIASTFDKPSDQHTQIAEMALEKAKRMVEYGHDVVIVLDGITRLSRAYNLAAPASGRILSGGIDAGALYPPKRFFGAARNVEEGGSLTILATALVETNSRMDEAVFEEFKGTGNMELRLDRKLAERRIYPAIDVDASSTRHEELLYDRRQLQMVWKLRRVLSGLAADGNAGPGLELLVDRLKTFRTNEEFLTEIAKQPGM